MSRFFRRVGPLRPAKRGAFGGSGSLLAGEAPAVGSPVARGEPASGLPASAVLRGDVGGLGVWRWIQDSLGWWWRMKASCIMQIGMVRVSRRVLPLLPAKQPRVASGRTGALADILSDHHSWRCWTVPGACSTRKHPGCRPSRAGLSSHRHLRQKHDPCQSHRSRPHRCSRRSPCPTSVRRRTLRIADRPAHPWTPPLASPVSRPPAVYRAQLCPTYPPPQ